MSDGNGLPAYPCKTGNPPKVANHVACGIPPPPSKIVAPFIVPLGPGRTGTLALQVAILRWPGPSHPKPSQFLAQSLRRHTHPHLAHGRPVTTQINGIKNRQRAAHAERESQKEPNDRAQGKVQTRSMSIRRPRTRRMLSTYPSVGPSSCSEACSATRHGTSTIRQKPRTISTSRIPNRHRPLTLPLRDTSEST